MTGDMDPKTNFALIVIQTELERCKYIVRSYLRARIAKVSSHRYFLPHWRIQPSHLLPGGVVYATWWLTSFSYGATTDR